MDVDYMMSQTEEICKKLAAQQALTGVKRFEGWADDQEALKMYRIEILRKDIKWIRRRMKRGWHMN